MLQATSHVATPNCQQRQSSNRLGHASGLGSTVEQAIGPEQHGFSRGRSILRNVLDVGETRVAVVKGDRAACILFVFKATFPSVAHDFVMRVLGDLRVPRAAKQTLAGLYWDITMSRR